MTVILYHYLSQHFFLNPDYLGLGHLQKLPKDLKSARNLEEKSDGKKGDKKTVVEETRLLTPDQGDIGQFTVQMFEDIRNSYIKSKYGIQMDNE